MTIVSSVEKGACGSCGHKSVCVYKERFKKAQNAVNDVIVCEEGNTARFLREIDFINPVTITCKYWLPMEQVTFR